MPITYDEAFSFLNFVLSDWDLLHPENYMAGNNHPVNTILMTLMYKWFGAGEIYLRLPNVLAFIVYTVFSWKFANKTSFSYFKYGLFILLIGTPFLLDFFSLARGYGLMLAFLMAALWQLFREKAGVKEIILFVLFSLIAVYSNLTAIHFVSMASGIFLFKIATGKIISVPRRIIHSFIFLISCLLAFLLIYPWATALIDIKTLFYGGKDGFWADTVSSLIKTTMYRQAYVDLALEFGSIVIGIVMTLCIILFVVRIFKSGYGFLRNKFSLALLLLTGSAFVGIVQHRVMGSNFLIERTALPFIPIFIITVFYFLDEINVKMVTFSSVLLISTLSLLHFFNTLNFSYTETWMEDRNSRDFFK